MSLKSSEQVILDPGRNEVYFHHVTSGSMGDMEGMAKVLRAKAVGKKFCESPRDL